MQRRLLCRVCEQRFAAKESIWATELDSRFDHIPFEFICTEDHRYFVASVVWRTLVWPDFDLATHPFGENDVEAIEKAERLLQRYLLGEIVFPERISFPWLHLVTPPHGFTGAPRNVNTYLRASLDATLNGWGDGLFTIAVCGGYLLVAALRVNGDALITWTLGTELRPGTVVRADPRAFPRDRDFINILVSRAAAQHQIPLSGRQNEDVKRRVESKLDPSLRSNPHIIAIMSDRQNDRNRAGG